MQEIKRSTFEIKKSKFIGIAYQVDSVQEVEAILKDLKREHKKARHIPFAYKIGPLAKKSDDKEPGNTAGSPIYNIIEKKKLDHILIVVIRYFGGVKLGAGGLTRAYLQAANDATKKD